MSVLNKFISLLNTWNTGLPLQTQWVCIIHQIPNLITNSIIRQYENVPLASQGDWGTPIDLASPDLVSGSSQAQGDSVTGLFFAQGIKLNGEYHNTRAVTPHTSGPIGGFIPGIVSVGREDFKRSYLTIELRESNLSFIDHLIRQWIVMGAHLGFVNYGAFGQQYNIFNIKSTIELRQYGKYTKNRHGEGGRPIRKRMMFYGVVPVQFEPFSLTYDAEDLNSHVKSVEFHYSHYSILPPQDTINNIANLNGPTALDNQISALIDLNNATAIASKYNSAVAQAQAQVAQQRQIALAQLEKLNVDSFVPEVRNYDSTYVPSSDEQPAGNIKATTYSEFREAEITAFAGGIDPQDNSKNFLGKDTKLTASSISFQELRELGYNPNSLSNADKSYITNYLQREIRLPDGTIKSYPIDDIGPREGLVADVTPNVIRELGGNVTRGNGQIIYGTEAKFTSDTIGRLPTRIVSTYVPPSNNSNGPTVTDVNGNDISNDAIPIAKPGQTYDDFFNPNFDEPSDGLLGN